MSGPVGRRPQRGYALALVLAGLLLISVAALALDERVQRWRESVQGWGGWVEQGGQLESARDEVLARIAVARLGQLGFLGLRVDGRPYRLPSGIHFSLQDTRGLLPVAEVQNEALLRSWLGRQGVKEPELSLLIDSLADYADRDDLRRLQGAEVRDYEQAGMPPPRNDWLMSPFELRRVMGWHRRPELWRRASDWAASTREPFLNPNTAPLEVLLAVPGASQIGVDRLLSEREHTPIGSAEQLQAVTGELWQRQAWNFHAGIVYRLRLWQPGAPRTLEYTVMLTPEAPAQPWAVLEVRHLPREPDDPRQPLPAPALPGAR